MKTVQILCVFVALLFGLNAIAQEDYAYRPEGYSFQGTGFLNNIPIYSEAFDVSGDGSMVVGMSYGYNGWTACYWTAELGMTALPLPSGWGREGLTFGVDDDGSTIIGEVNNASFYAEAIRWEKFMPIPMGLRANDHSTLRAISPDGNSMIGYQNLGYIELEFIFWKGGEPTSLGRFDGILPISIANDGTIVGRSFIGGEQAYRLNSDGLEFLFEERSVAADISADGSIIVGGVDLGSGEYNPFVWENGAIEVIDVQTGGIFLSIATNGQMAVGKTNDSRPFVWDGHRVQMLDSLLRRNGINLNGWQWLQPLGVSNTGTIVGVARGPTNRTEGWVATIP